MMKQLLFFAFYFTITLSGIAQTYSLNSSGTSTCPHAGIDNTFICVNNGAAPVNLGTFTDTNLAGDQILSMDLIVYGACSGDVEFFINGTSVASGTATGLGCNCQSIADDPQIPQNYTVTMSPAIQAAYIEGGDNTLTVAASNSAAGAQCFYGADITVSTVTLPVEFISFKGNLIQNVVQLDWVIATEVNSRKYEIERAGDEFEFRKIGEITANGTTLGQSEYSFVDNNPAIGTNYYRLKLIGVDNQIEHSEVVSVENRKEKGVIGEFYPNPSSLGVVNLQYYSAEGKPLTVSVYDMTGRLYFNEIRSISMGNNNMKFDLSAIGSGIFIVGLADGENPTYRKLVIK